MKIEQLLKEYAHDLGIELLGICSAEPFAGTRRTLADRQREGIYVPFQTTDLERRTRPQLILPGARSIISIAVPYRQAEAAAHGAHLFLARAARGIDYHVIIADLLAKFAAFLHNHISREINLQTFVDHTPLVERAVARRAGLGWWGKNCCLITERYGSWVFLAELLTDLELEADPPSAATACGSCRRCIDACPTGALEAPYRLNPQLCLSYRTQARGYVPRALRPLIGNRIYGCDSCQEACPANKDTALSATTRLFLPDRLYQPDLSALLAMTGRTMPLVFGPSSACWVGPSTLVRNAIIAAGNSGDDRYLPQLQQLLQGSNVIHRGHAAWSIGRLGGSRVRRLLEKQLARESDEHVKAEIRASLEA